MWPGNLGGDPGKINDDALLSASHSSTRKIAASNRFGVWAARPLPSLARLFDSRPIGPFETYGSDGRLDGRAGAADVDQFYAGWALASPRTSGSQASVPVSPPTRSRPAWRNESDGTLYQGGGYVAYNVAGSYFDGGFFGQAAGKTDLRGYTAGGAGGHRVMLDRRSRVTPMISVGVTGVKRNAFTETVRAG